MPPVAKQRETFSVALARLIAQKQNGIGSIRGLAKELAAQKGTTQESERRAIRRHLDGTEPDEKTIAAYARAFEVDRATLPPEQSGRGQKSRQVLLKSEELRQRMVKSVRDLKALERRSLRSGADDPSVKAHFEKVLAEVEAMAELAQEIEDLHTPQEAPREHAESNG